MVFIENKPTIIQGSFPGGRPYQSVLLYDRPAGIPCSINNNNNSRNIVPVLQPFMSNGNSSIYRVDASRVKLSGTGNPLPNEVLQKMENLFKTNFKDVRIHTSGGQAESIGALAFASGNNIYFAQGRYNPSTSHGDRLLAHELTHVVQQKARRVQNPFGTGIAVVQNPGLEAEAERMSIRSQTLQMVRGPKKLVRTNFTRQTQKTLVLKRGQHRRHIISHHHIKDALQSWYDVQNGFLKGSKLLNKLQSWLDRMNNNLNNLIPGPGNVNSAIGMLSHQLEKVLNTVSKSKKKLTTKDLRKLLEKYQGFQIHVQKELTTPIYKALGKDKSFKQFVNEALELVKDVQFSTDFDWPGDDDSYVYHEWKEVYMRFLNLKNYPHSYDYGDVEKLVKKFMKLPKPSGKHG